MGQYSIIVQSSDDLAAFPSSSGKSFEILVDGTPTIRVSNQTAIWMRWDGVPIESSSFDVVFRSYNNSGTSTAGDRGAGVAVYQSGNDCVYVKAHGSAGNAAGRVLSLGFLQYGSTVDGPGGTLHYSRLVADHTTGVLRYKWWLGELADEPADWLIDLTGLSFPFSSGGVGMSQIRSYSGGFMGIAEIYVGTEGDPAPTGLSERRRSPLLLTPW